MDQSRFRHLSATLAGSLFCRDSWSHAAVILTFGAVLGVGFNSANPNGVAWRLPASKAASADPVRPPTALLPGSASAEQPAAPPPHCMSWEQLALRVSQNTALAVDLRSAADYQAGHVPKAVSCPLENLGADLDSPAWQTFRARAHVHHYVVLYGAEQPTDAMQRFRGRLVEELGYAMVMFATDGYRGWEARQTERKARIADSESKARDRMKAQAAVPPEARVAAVTYAQAAALRTRFGSIRVRDPRSMRRTFPARFRSPKAATKRCLIASARNSPLSGRSSSTAAASVAAHPADWPRDSLVNSVSPASIICQADSPNGNRSRPPKPPPKRTCHESR